MRLLVIVLSAILGGCASPMASLQPDIDRFKKEYPDHFTTLKDDHGSLHFAWSGDPSKRPLLFVHGSPGSWDAWAHFLLNPDLQKNFHVIAVDRDGYGGSDHGKTQTSLAVQASDILRALTINTSSLPAILIGHSYGGPVIARAAMDHPKRVAGLVFVASSVAPELEDTKWIQYPAGWWPIRVLIPTALRVCNEEILPLKGELLQMLPRWKSITAKVITIQGQDDDLVPPGNQDFLLRELNPQTIVNTVRVPGLNHFVPWKRPDLIEDAIRTLDRSLKKI